jgi:hypothetical protein
MSWPFITADEDAAEYSIARLTLRASYGTTLKANPMRKVARTRSVLIATVICVASSRADAQSPSLQELLDRGTAYVNEFFERFSNVVAEEHYAQEAGSPATKRVLRSDFLLVTFPGLEGRMSFRDVFEVDGRVVRDAGQQDRLVKLFADAPRDIVERAHKIAATSARYNLAEFGELTDPLITLGFLQAEFRPRFRFGRGRLEKDLGEDVRTITFEERERPTVLRTPTNDDLAARGSIWISEQTGRVVKTSMLLGSRTRGSEIVTTYRWNDEFQMNVPAEMQTSLAWPAEGAIPKRNARGVATYSGLRRFQVHTAEAIR